MSVRSKVLVATGMHRSGTSMLAGFLQTAGLSIGDELLGANETNKKGHFEDVAFLKLHEDALEELGEDRSGWTLKRFELLPPEQERRADDIITRYSSRPQWGWKDPRTCLFLNYWDKKLPHSNYVFVFRRPWEVADSLYRRGDKAFAQNGELAFQIWKLYNQCILTFCEQYPQRTLLLSLDALVDAPRELIRELNRKFGTNLDEAAQLDHEPGLMNQRARQHQRFVMEQLPDVYGLWQQLERASWRGYATDMTRILSLPPRTKEAYFADWLAAGKTHDLLNNWKIWQRKTLQECMLLQEQNDQLRRQLFDTETNVNQLEYKLTAISKSKVWRVRNSCAVLLGKTPV